MRVQPYRFSAVRKFAEGGYVTIGQAAEVPDTAIDRGAMAVLAVISTEDVDRSLDVVRTLGIRTEQHRRSPVGLYDHGEHWTFPVSKYEDPSGQYTVKLNDGYATGRAYYDQHNAMSEQVFGLIDRGFLRGHSIGFRPLKAVKRALYDEDGYRDEKARGLDVLECELLEISTTAVGDNPNCIAVATEIFHKNRLNGRPLLDVVKKSLARYATPVRRNQAVGGWEPVAKSHAPKGPAVGDDYGSQSLMALLALSRHLGGPDDDAARRAMALVAEGLDGGPDVAGLSGPSDPVVKSWAIRKAWVSVGPAGTTPAGTQKFKWRDDQTGEVRRQVSAPKGASTRQKPAGKGKAGEGAPEKGKEEKQAPAPAKGRAGKADAAEARRGAEEAILAHLADPKGIDADALSSVAEKLQAMHGDDLRALASSMKQAVSGAKLAVAGRIAAAMLARAKGDPEAGKAKGRGKAKAKAEPETKQPWEMTQRDLARKHPDLWAKIRSKHPSQPYENYLREAWSRGMNVPLELRAKYVPASLDSEERASLNQGRETVAEAGDPTAKTRAEFLSLLPSGDYRAHAEVWDKIARSGELMRAGQEMLARESRGGWSNSERQDYVESSVVPLLLRHGIAAEAAGMLAVVASQGRKHKEAVGKRLSDGMSVSDRVLADYPDLAPAKAPPPPAPAPKPAAKSYARPDDPLAWRRRLRSP